MIRQNVKKQVVVMENRNRKNYALQSVDRALQILSLFSEQTPELSLTEISRRMEMSNPVTLKYLNTLAQRGFLARDCQTKRYSLGLALAALGGIVRRNHAVSQAAYPIMEKLAATVGESVYLQVPVLSNDEAVVLEMVETKQAVISRFESACKLYAGASRKVLLAYLGEEYFQQFLQRVNMQPYTEKTNIDIQQLREEIRIIRQQGYAVSYGETVEGACGIAAPVFDAAGIAASLMIYVPQYRMDERVQDFHLKHVLRAAQEISERLGGGGAV